MKRIYSDIVNNHLKNYPQMVFLSGGRQVGKTTIASNVADALYLNWDNIVHRKKMLHLLEELDDIHQYRQLNSPNIIIFDEFHKFKNWKNYIKGFYDTYKANYQIILTGSARLNIYRKSSDSLMGRYFNYTVHPLSLGEILRPQLGSNDIQPPIISKNNEYELLYKFGGYPDPFIRQQEEFHLMWQNLRFEQLFRQDIRDVEDIKLLSQLEMLAHILQAQSGNLCQYANLANKIQVSSVTLKKWITLLESFYYCFTIKPYSTNISKSLIKEPKIYLHDWSVIVDDGARFENFLASHLAKSIDLWNESGKGRYNLYYIRTKDQKEVDFLVTKNHQPWILVEAKLSNNAPISKNLIHFKQHLNVPYAFQVVHNLDYIDKSCFDAQHAIIVPAKTFLSQLV
jgi:predicted AAA+ superfamily ATPase